MTEQLLPIGGYEYREDILPEEAWENLLKAQKEETSIIVRMTKEDPETQNIHLDYHGLQGYLMRGYISRESLWNTERNLGKTTRVVITKIDKSNRTFTASRLPIEEQAKEEIKNTLRTETVEGTIISIDPSQKNAFVELKEGISAFLSIKKVTRLPNFCASFSNYYHVGDKVTGIITYISPVSSHYRSFCNMSLFLTKDGWETELKEKQIKVGSILSGYPHKDFVKQGTYYIEYTRQLCITLKSAQDLPEKNSVSMVVTAIDLEKNLIQARLEDEEKHQPAPPDKEKKSNQHLSMFSLPVKATACPFSVWDGDTIAFETNQGKYVAMRQIENKIRIGHINNDHFSILQAINNLGFATSKMIASYFYINKPELTLSRDKINTRINAMTRDALLDCVRFEGENGKGIFRVYFLSKNGHLLLQNYLGQKNTSYKGGLVSSKSETIKTQLATNQFMQGCLEKMPSMNEYHRRQIIRVQEGLPLRPSGILEYPQCGLLVESVRRSKDWQNNLSEKMERYGLFQKAHDRHELPFEDRRIEFIRNKIAIIVLCEDFDHVKEVKELLKDQPIYPHLLFSYDLAIYRRPVNEWIFQLTSDDEVIFYDIRTLAEAGKLRKTYGNPNEAEEENYILEFEQRLRKGYEEGRTYLNAHKDQLADYIHEKYACLYSLAEDGSYCTAVSEYQYLLYHLLMLDRGYYEKKEKAAMPQESNEFFWEENPVSDSEEKSYAKPSELEDATSMVLSSFEEWLKVYLNRQGKHINITKHAHKQATGLQFGYDIGLNSEINDQPYRLCFECKDYTQYDVQKEGNRDKTIRAKDFAYNLLQFYMHCDSTRNNRWILISPYGNLPNEFDLKLIEHWNRDHDYLQISMFVQTQTSPTCEQFLSLNPDAYRLVYKKEAPELSYKEKEELFQHLYDCIIGKKTVENAYIKKMESFDFWNTSSYRFHEQLMSVQTEDGKAAIPTIFHLLDNTRKAGLYIIGEYGTGKTWLLYQLIEEITRNPERHHYLPVFVSLKDNTLKKEMTGDAVYNPSESQHAESFVNNNIIAKYGEKLSSVSARETILFMLDGYDEVLSGLSSSDTKIDFLYKCYKKLSSLYPGSRFLITSRESDYEACKNHRKFRQVTNDFEKMVLVDCSPKEAMDAIKRLAHQPGTKVELKERLLAPDNMEKFTRLVRRPVFFSFLKDFSNELESDDIIDEYHILDNVIENAIKNVVANPELVRKRLIEYAITLTKSQNQQEIMIDSYETEGLLNQVAVSIVKIRADEYENRYISFQHNIIREFLVARRLYDALRRDYEKLWKMKRSILSPSSEFLHLLAELSLTPEMQGFLIQCMENDPLGNACFELLKNSLENIAIKTDKKLASSILSIILRPGRELSGSRYQPLDLSNIQAENLFLWRCQLYNLNLRNAVITNLQMFDSELSDIDLRGANLAGLYLGSDTNVQAVASRRYGNTWFIHVLYQNGTALEYQIADLAEPDQYKILPKDSIANKNIRSMTFSGETLITYNEKQIFTETGKDVLYQIISAKELRGFTHAHESGYISYEDANGYTLLFYQGDHYDHRHLNRLITKPVWVTAERELLFENAGVLYLHDGKTETYLYRLDTKTECELFTARKEGDNLWIYVKEEDSVTILQFDTSYQLLSTQTKEIRGLVPTQCHYLEYLDQGCLLVGNEVAVYILTETEEFMKSTILQTKVKCGGLNLGDEENGNRVQDDLAYELLRRNLTM